MSKSTGASAPGGLSSFPLTHDAQVTSRPNAADMPKLAGGTFTGSQGQPTSPGGATKAIYDHGARDSVRYIPGAPEPKDEPPQGKLGVYNARGVRIGHTGPKAGPSVAGRMLGHNNVRLGKVKSRPAWISDGPARPARVSSLPRAKSLRADKGSNK